MGACTRSWVRSLFVLILLVVVAFLSRTLWLPTIGERLVKAGSPEKAEMIVVLAGDEWGNRMIKAGQLVQQGFAAQVLVSGPFGMYEHYESDLAIDLAVKHGFPRSFFISLPNNERNTRDEAKAVLKELRARGIHKFLLVTSDTHTRRAGSVYRELAPEMEITVVASENHLFRLAEWWKEREGQKAVFIEWAKTIANWCGI